MYVKLVNFIDTLNQYRKTKISNRNFLVIAALIVGILAGCAAALLKSLTHYIENFLQSGFQWHYKYYLYIFFPMIGILLSVMYTRRYIRKGKFETGLTPVLYTISKKSSKVEPHNIYSQIITAALTVGFGGSTGLGIADCNQWWWHRICNWQVFRFILPRSNHAFSLWGGSGHCRSF